MKRQDVSLRVVLWFILAVSSAGLYLVLSRLYILGVPFQSVVDTSVAVRECLKELSEIKPGLEIERIGHRLCEPSNSDILQYYKSAFDSMKKLARTIYLLRRRRYRISGLICNTPSDSRVPKYDDEVAFMCLPLDYRNRACMGGRVEWPQHCRTFGPKNWTNWRPRDRLKELGPYMVNNVGSVTDCDAPGAMCSEQFVGLGGMNLHRPEQYTSGLPEAKLLTVRSDGRPVWTTAVFEFLINMLRRGEDISPKDYDGAQSALKRAMEIVEIRGKRVLVLGSVSPWVEALAIHSGAVAPTLTCDYNVPVSLDSRLQTQSISLALDDETQYDIVVAYSSIEHDGQGRYGDALDPDGDLAALEEIWLKIKPGGVLLLNVPLSRDDNFFWYGQRDYGPTRLPLLTRGFDYLGLVTRAQSYTAVETLDLEVVSHGGSPVLILRKPHDRANIVAVVDAAVDAPLLIDAMNPHAPNGLECDPLGKCRRSPM